MHPPAYPGTKTPSLPAGFFISTTLSQMARKPTTASRSTKPANSSKRSRKPKSDDKSAATSEQAPIRAEGGRFQKGVSGNPGGRPKALLDMQELAREHTVDALLTLVFWMKSDDGKVAVSAANAVLDRAWGKPTQPISGEDGKPIDINLNEVRSGIAGKLARVAAASAKG